MSQSVQLSIVVPLKNEAAHISACLASLQAQDLPADQYEIIVVDNGSTDDSVQLASHFSAVHIVKAPGVHVGAVRNIGAQHARGQILVFIDADCTANPGWLRNILTLLSDGVDALGGGIYLPEHPALIERCWLLEGPDGHVLPKVLIGAAIAIRRPVFLQLGGFNEQVTSGEDSELSATLQGAGFNLVMSRLVSVTHLGNAKTASAFIKRQIWHSENYLRSHKHLMTDPVFMLVLLFSVSVYATVATLLVGGSLLFPLLGVALPPLVLSAKRIGRTHLIGRYLGMLPAIYYLDLLYLIGRSIGLHKSIRGLLT